MRTASRQGGRWWTVVVALCVAFAAWSVSRPAIAHEPTDVRVVSATRGDDGAVTIIVSVPMQQVGAATAPGGLSVSGADGVPMAPVVAALPPSATAVVVLVHTAGADVTTLQRATGAAAELLRTLDPAVPVAIVSTAGVVMAPLGTDRGAGLAALGHPSALAPAAFPAALGAVGTQLAGRGYVDPLAVLIDAGAGDPGAVLPLDALAPAGIGWRIIPIGPATSPLVAQFAQRTGAAVPVASDPIALVDDAAGLVAGRFSLRLPASAAGPLTVRLHGTGGDLSAAVTVPALVAATTVAATSTATTVPAVTTAAVTTPAGTRVPATTVVAVSTTPVVLVERPAVVAPPPPPSDASSSWLGPVIGGAVAVVAVAGGALLIGRRRSAGRADEPEAEPEPDGGTTPDAAFPAPTGAPAPEGATPARYHYTDLSQPLPSGAAKSRPRREIVARVPAPAAAPSPASVSFEQRRRVLTLAQELGNVSEACRIVGVSRRSYYEWKRIADEQGVEALRPRREVRRSQDADES